MSSLSVEFDYPIDMRIFTCELLPRALTFPRNGMSLLKRGVVGIGASGVAVRVGALVILKRQVALVNARLFAKICASSGTDAPSRRAPKA
jgi:hypothetical protein